MELKLKPCPFCGGKGRVRKFENGYRIVCAECGASSHYAYIKPWHDSKFVAQRQAAKAWNNRVKVKEKSREDLELTKALEQQHLRKEDVYTFSMRLCDNDIDRDFERFDDGTLDEPAPMFVGKVGIFDHLWPAKKQAARIYRTEVVSDNGALTADGKPYRFLKGWAYIKRTDESAALIAEIDSGIKREVSVGCAVKRVVCSICGGELNKCPHKKGEEYNGQLCYGILTEATDAYDWAFVITPSKRKEVSL